MHRYFTKIARATTAHAGSPLAFILSLLIIIIWGITGPLFDYSDTWQLVINTGTTIVTFLIVFLIQNTQNRASKALHLKLDEIIYAQQRASNKFINIEGMDDEELEVLHGQLTQQLSHRRTIKTK